MSYRLDPLSTFLGPGTFEWSLPPPPLPLSLRFQRISFVVCTKMLHVNDLPKLSLLVHRLDLVAYGPDWTDNLKWSFEHRSELAIVLFRPVVQYEISRLI
ncbi:hypothetical protein AVEN_93470-1 [Araneus ventricosus]|uniref:Uncharacterized protein n=1 Tax=Araneus ventricosus TaxID=182803 RepID=A0A4Y2AR10_ARAVE|nr:hypothetical protein AVEN_93470-1 [Araneus ventricosus]